MGVQYTCDWICWYWRTSMVEDQEKVVQIDVEKKKELL